MILTGRTGLVALIGVLLIVFSPWPATAFTSAGALAVAVAADVALAAGTRRLRCTRSGTQRHGWASRSTPC